MRTHILIHARRIEQKLPAVDWTLEAPCCGGTCARVLEHSEVLVDRVELLEAENRNPITGTPGMTQDFHLTLDGWSVEPPAPPDRIQVSGYGAFDGVYVVHLR